MKVYLAAPNPAKGGDLVGGLCGCDQRLNRVLTMPGGGEASQPASRGGGRAGAGAWGRALSRAVGLVRTFCRRVPSQPRMDIRGTGVHRATRLRPAGIHRRLSGSAFSLQEELWRRAA